MRTMLHYPRNLSHTLGDIKATPPPTWSSLPLPPEGKGLVAAGFEPTTPCYRGGQDSVYIVKYPIHIQNPLSARHADPA
jgi:hypothetical protein